MLHSNMFEWVCHKMFRTLLGYTGLNSTYWPKKFDLVCQTVFPFSCERVGSGCETNLIPYSTKFSWVLSFANFVSFQQFAKLLQRKFFARGRALIDNMLPNPQGTLSKEIPKSRHCFADSCKLKRGQWCDSVH